MERYNHLLENSLMLQYNIPSHYVGELNFIILLCLYIP